MRTRGYTPRRRGFALPLLDRVELPFREPRLTRELAAPVPRLVRGELLPFELRTRELLLDPLADVFVASSSLDALRNARRD